MKKTLSLIFYVLFSLVTIVKGQVNYNQLPTVIPSAPNAAALSKYGNLDVGLQTGSLNYSIPLFAIESGNWKMPIDLQYSTSGIKVDQIASRVGMGWAFNGGGVITRNVNGYPDSPTNRSTLPANWASFDQSFLTYLQNASGNPSYDTEPDVYMYNFNGYSGKFIIDENGAAMLMPYNNLKINLTYSNSESTSIIITTPDGAVYHFTTIELTSSNAVCYGGSNNTFATRVPTSWYLTKVVLPNQEVVTFTYKDCYYQYDSGISQTLTRSFDAENSENNGCEMTKCASVNTESICNNGMTSYGKILTQISFRSQVISFNYIDRQDVTRPDPGLSSDQLLSSVQIKNNGQLLKTFSFNYIYSTASAGYASPYGQAMALRYRPFLNSLTEQGVGITEVKKHSFYYNDINGLPPRLSYSQDLFGYFNSKSNSNFVPVPDNSLEQGMFSKATADRSSDLWSSLKGSLTKIVYPTGGSDSINYELNVFRGINSIPPPTATKAVSILPRADYPVTVSSTSFTPFSAFNILINGGALIATGSDGSSNVDPLVDLLRVEIVRSSNQSIVFTRTLRLNQGLSNQAVTSLAAGTAYILRITSLYPGIRCSASVIYETGASSQVEVNKTTGGLRVAKITSTDNFGTPSIKKFYYSFLNDLTKSSGKQPNQPRYSKDVYSAIAGNCGPGPGAQVVALCKSRMMYSNSINNIYRYSQNHSYYQRVIEGSGEDFENGGVEHTYMIEPDALSRPVFGMFLSLGVRTSNSAVRNGLELERLVFKKQGSNFININKTINHYKVDTAINRVIDAYVITQQYIYPIHIVGNLPKYEEFGGYEVNKYQFYSKWAYADSTSVIEYDEQGNNSLILQTDYTYANPLHAQVTRVHTLNSNNRSSDVITRYPHEMVAEGKDPAGVYQAMINSRVIQPVTEEQQLNNNIQTKFTKINYFQPYTKLFYPEYIQQQALTTQPLETRIRYHNYDSKGNVTSVSVEKGSKINYVWSYNSQYPIAEIKNAEYSAIVTALGGATAVNNFANSIPASKTVIDNFLAPIRNSLTTFKDAQITSYTYAPLTGMTSSTDAKGMVTSYEYDGLQRLMNIKDQDLYIIKNFDYHYKP
nr:hypothetical protein [Pedobacter panaciterrae]